MFHWDNTRIEKGLWSDVSTAKVVA